jgi:tetratricopeptide (TPR) repeat protein
MLRFITARRLAAVLAVLAAVALSVPASAQSTGMVKGRVLDAQGQPVEGARVSIEFMSGMTRKFEVKTNKKGEYIQIGLSPGQYKLTAEKDKLGSQSFDVRVGLGATLETNFTLNPSAVPSMTKEEATKLDAFKKVFDAGVAASQANNHDEAIARFTEAAGMRADCYACYYNMGSSQLQKQDYAAAEVSYKKAMEIKPDNPEPYNALGTIYNAQKKFAEAAQMTEEATKRQGTLGSSLGGNADALFNQGVIFWNAGKMPEAKKQFEEAIRINPDHAEAQYWTGMAHLNEGAMKESVEHFEKYLALAPTGQYAEQCKGILATLKK